MEKTDRSQRGGADRWDRKRANNLYAYIHSSWTGEGLGWGRGWVKGDKRGGDGGHL